ncbi:hypothetical protein B0G81_5839 [Paraburkholderia sp. BL6665CI2N2]|uniref:hypothetical protein n=1 Tax=Paraburkholderia sp. BL6665CI2N2 TaxID=1938806 RepID=UPI0010F40A83|nr:hypothetical protein [Paraburkholderia sp. BL6665CI2N2]TDY25378.1 hypothetical protein B0G81_5839 [Paraburkholderia sp. BL6665CI2N2]
MEPNGPNTFNPSANNLDSFYKSGNVMRLIRLDGIPAWASSTGAFQDDMTLPTDISYCQSYMSRVGTESNAIRAAYFPTQSANYYQVTWEPDADGGLPWRDTDANFIAMYKAEHGTALVLFRRTDATLGDFYFTGGAPSITRYPSGNGLALGEAQELGKLPGLFSETVRIDRLAQ